ncbi:sigma-70 family RNA polymerase sigma factor [Sphingomonas sp. CGMCC 1.13654]|uniref:Sigma-70 family RNA polymerase sigma factor n=1 Tax=Sphingomonas chungangi TaxID=2683589 RepID=A0A838L6F1_9SPHN|nr:sigma-70 family RNA polymerase sigma factor [Sphingomonas chungangi]MBA2934627.1 sigma-70 family RNA polymerase sigma factor [Sphingomonas chungangi]MVW57663.1 sigma-70 family RNA polymerase sigma factor [Sphingomonas chungangi]
MVTPDRDDPDDRSPIDAGDLDRIYRVEGPRLARYLGRRLPSGQDALDLVHEAFLRFAKARSDRALDRPGAYLQRIARNLLIDRSKRPESKFAALHVPIETGDELREEARQEQEIELKDMIGQYRQALDELPRKTREVFLLQRVHDLTYREIAERMGISIPTVQYHIARALVHLDQRLDRL